MRPKLSVPRKLTNIIKRKHRKRGTKAGMRRGPYRRK